MCTLNWFSRKRSDVLIQHQFWVTLIGSIIISNASLLKAMRREYKHAYSELELLVHVLSRKYNGGHLKFTASVLGAMYSIHPRKTYLSHSGPNEV